MGWISWFFRKSNPAPDEVHFSARDGQVSVQMSVAPDVYAAFQRVAAVAAGGDLSRYMRACLRLGLPVFAAHPALRDALGHKPRGEECRTVSVWITLEMHDHLLRASQSQKSLLMRAAASFGNTYFSTHPEHLNIVGGEI